MPLSAPAQDAASHTAGGSAAARVDVWTFSFMFFLSGVAALIYQIVWAKELSLVFGVTLYATSAVVTTFMAGLAFGSLYFGRLVESWKNPLVLFAVLEAVIGAFAFAFPAIVVVLKRVYVAFYGPFGDSFYVMSLVRFVLAFCALIVPTTMMGGTLPVITRALVTRRSDLGRKVATLYSANNLGAFVGCVAAGYFMLEMLGPRGAMGVASVLNVAAAAMALSLSRAPRASGEPTGPQAEPMAPTAGPTHAVRVALWVFGLEGVTSLIYQMAWMRMLIFFVHMDIYGVTAIVATFLAGLSIGAFVARRWVDRLRDPWRVLGGIELSIGLTAMATIPVLPFLLGIHRAVLSLQGQGLPLAVAFSAANFAVTFLVILVPTACMGATLPVVSRIYVSELRGLGRKMGVLGCLDTVGSILGAFAGGFVLIPLLGVQRTIIVTAAMNLVLSAWVFHADPLTERRRVLRPGFLLAGAAAAAALMLLPLRPAALIRHSEVMTGQPILRLVVSEDDEVQSASVIEQKGFARLLYCNDHWVAADSPEDRPSHEIVLHTPLLLHPHPKRVLIIGLGIGLSAYASLAHDVDVDVVELSRAVVDVNSAFTGCFDDYMATHNGRGVLQDPRVTVREEDGRNYVLGTGRRYDVIHVGGFHPVLTGGAAGFYTVEFYRDCQRILTPDGLFSQWLPIHQIPAEDFKTILRSFRAGFPYTSIWHKNSADFCMLLGSLTPQRVDFADFERRVDDPAMLRRLARCNVHEVYDLLDSFCMSAEAIDRAVGPGPLQTDRHPTIEYHKFRGMASDDMRNLALLAQARESVWPHLSDVPPQREPEVRARLATWFRATQQLLRAQCIVADRRPMSLSDFQASFAQAAQAYQAALALNPDDANARFLWGRALARHELSLARYCYDVRQRDLALEHLRRSAEASPDTRWGAEAKFLLEEAGRGIFIWPR
jgi:spermidine synthase